ncbi:ferritin-like domain-containing protein [Paenibacillus sp. sgz302251]|uniref:ferritin-like domain-containing protein n=1 Tax=Paenibacillus sp. sgz302251 TaxID=3414493 RepID=UPI003C7B8834
MTYYAIYRVDLSAYPMMASRDVNVLALISESVGGEREDELFYNYLIQAAPTQQEKQVITSIRDDERKHGRMFREIYYYLTGTMPAAPSTDVMFQPPDSYTEGIQKALLGELKAFEKYRSIYLNIRPELRDRIFEIMTDEIKHASYYNWLYAKNK